MLVCYKSVGLFTALISFTQSSVKLIVTDVILFDATFSHVDTNNSYSLGIGEGTVIKCEDRPTVVQLEGSSAIKSHLQTQSKQICYFLSLF